MIGRWRRPGCGSWARLLPPLVYNPRILNPRVAGRRGALANHGASSEGFGKRVSEGDVLSPCYRPTRDIPGKLDQDERDDPLGTTCDPRRGPHQLVAEASPERDEPDVLGERVAPQPPSSRSRNGHGIRSARYRRASVATRWSWPGSFSPRARPRGPRCGAQRRPPRRGPAGRARGVRRSSRPSRLRDDPFREHVESGRGGVHGRDGDAELVAPPHVRWCFDAEPDLATTNVH
jgi:hypothetical protein